MLKMTVLSTDTPRDREFYLNYGDSLAQEIVFFQISCAHVSFKLWSELLIVSCKSGLTVIYMVLDIGSAEEVSVQLVGRNQ
jgi:hypothetical protein